MLEPYDGKLSSTVLRGESGRKARDLPDPIENIIEMMTTKNGKITPLSCLKQE
jgi:hypothetical protein